MSKDYEVGYRKPPKHTQFKKGRSGNPKGRPKGCCNMSTIMKEVMARPVVIKQNGQERRVPFREAFVHRLAGRSLEGRPSDMIALMKAMHNYLPSALEPEHYPENFTVTYVLPNGKTMESYDKLSEMDNLDPVAPAECDQTTRDDDCGSGPDVDDDLERAWRASGIDDEPEGL